MTGRVLTSHAAFERRYPDEAEFERIYDNSRRAAHIRAHGSDDGYRPLREFPCPGDLLALPDDGSPFVTVACDACPYTFTARPEHLPRLQSAPF